jgi:hypothetical protein
MVLFDGLTPSMLEGVASFNPLWTEHSPRQNGGLHKNYIRYGQKSRNPGNRFRADIRVVFFQTKIFINHLAPLFYNRCRVRAFSTKFYIGYSTITDSIPKISAISFIVCP